MMGEIMSDRHLHCVYFQYVKNNDIKGICLLNNKEIERGFEHCCENIVLKPSEILTYCNNEKEKNDNDNS